MKPFTQISPAKINLGLRITGKRPDGYHLLETCFYPVADLYDEISIESADSFEIHEDGIIIGGKPDDNLMFKAWSVLKVAHPEIPFIRIRIRKSIPAGAGLGGGSSNAATVGNMLNRLFNLGISEPELARLLAPLGADVPFFVYQEPMMAIGIGQDLHPATVNMSGYRIRLFPQPFHSSTVAAYRALVPSDYSCGNPIEEILQDSPETWKDRLVNDLEKPVLRLIPELAHVKDEIYQMGAVYAAMSGSGSAFFGIFKA